jgi:hypothetical protein
MIGRARSFEGSTIQMVVEFDEEMPGISLK